MKVLFLDIDGVINTVGAEVGYHYMGYKFPFRKPRTEEFLTKHFDPACMYYFYTIIEETGCKIVVSSTWRHGSSLDDMKGWFLDDVISSAIIDKTKSLDPDKHPALVDKRGRIQRGEEIYEWLERHPEVTTFAVLDDDNDMDAIRMNFFQTDSHDGLKRELAQKVISFLNNKEMLDHYRLDIDLNTFFAELNDCLSIIPQKERKEAEEKIIKIVSKLIQKNEYYRKEEDME